MTARVFIVEAPRVHVDTSAASEFGALTVVFNHENRRGSVFKPAEYTTDFLAALDRLKYDPSVDYFCVLGSMLGTCLAFAAIARRYGKFKMLVYNSSLCRYVEKEYDVTVEQVA